MKYSDLIEVNINIFVVELESIFKSIIQIVFYSCVSTCDVSTWYVLSSSFNSIYNSIYWVVPLASPMHSIYNSTNSINT